MGRKGISPLLTSIIIFGVLVLSTMLVLNQTLPMIEKSKDSASIAEAQQAMSSLDSAIQELLYESPGASRMVNFKAPLGSISVSSKDNQIQYFIDTRTQIMEPGVVIKKGNLVEAYGTGINAYETDVDNDGETDLVLENEAIIFALRKLGNATDHVFLNTTNSTKPVITAMKNKRLGINMTPAMGLYINNLTNSSFGLGYTELAQKGERLPSGTIRLYLASNASITYEAFFRLLPGQDYIMASVWLR